MKLPDTTSERNKGDTYIFFFETNRGRSPKIHSLREFQQAGSSYHYRSRLLCRRPQALGKVSKALDKAFAERSSRQSALGENPIGKGFFAESRLSGSARRSAKREIKKYEKNLKKIFFNRGRGPLASVRPSPLKSQVAAFFAQNSRLRGRRDSNS
jgi:hypothetical protein